MDDPARLTPEEADALQLADTLDSGTLSELLAGRGETIAYVAASSTDELRDVAACALILARRIDATADQEE